LSAIIFSTSLRLRRLNSSSACHRAQALACFVAALLILSPAQPCDAAALEEKLTVCFACHGADGQSVTPEVPSLGGQPIFYLTVQLLMFREKIRIVEPMNQALQGFADDDLRAMALSLSQLPAPAPATGSVNTERMERVRALIEQNRCNFCHQKNYSGEENAPRLAGQREDYLVKAMREYKNNTRRGYDAAMADVLFSISEEQILDLAYFLSRLR
jgi:cytochrome c553